MLAEAEWPVVSDVLPTGSPVLSAAQRALMAAVRAAAKTRKSVPCLVESEPLWLSSSSADHRRAVRLCKACPVIEHCQAVADAQPASFGVWAGRIYSNKGRRRPRGQDLPSTAARRLRASTTAAEGTGRGSPQRRARNQALFGMSSAGWSSSALAAAAGMSQRQIVRIISAERRRNRPDSSADRAA